MQPKSGPRLLITHREGAVYLERCRVHVDGERIVCHVADDDLRREFNLPYANIAVLFLGQGTSISQEAMQLLGEQGVHLAITGSGGTPLHMGALTTYHGTAHFRRLLPIYLDEAKSLAASKALMLERVACMRDLGFNFASKWLKVRDFRLIEDACGAFEAALKTVNSMQELLGHEGQFTKACYAHFAKLSGSAFAQTEFRREHGLRGQADPLSLVNSLIDHGNYLCYGMSGAALWALGIPPHMSIFHGKTRSGGLVFDLADGFKDAFVLPAAFGAVIRKSDEDPEQAFRKRVISAFDDKEVLVRAIRLVETMIVAGSAS